MIRTGEKMTEPDGTLADKLEKLFAEVRKPDGSKYTQAEVVEGTHGALTRVYLWKLRTGRAANPGFHIIKALADFFGVDTSYFSQNEASGSEEEKMRHTGRYFKAILERAAWMDDKAQKAILDLMDYLLSLKESQDGEGS
jgi:transcriptional regulator with XRE-family HTH domain